MKIVWLMSKKFNCKEIEKFILLKGLIIKKGEGSKTLHLSLMGNITHLYDVAL